MEIVEFEGMDLERFLEKLGIIQTDGFIVTYLRGYITGESETNNTFDLVAVRNNH